MSSRALKKTIPKGFREIIEKRFPSVKMYTMRANQFSTNTRILLPIDATNTRSDKETIVKIEQVTVGMIPRNKFTPVLVSTRRQAIFLLGARLSTHGGEIAVEIARRIIKKAGHRLVVLGMNILAFTILNTVGDVSGPGAQENLVGTIETAVAEFQAINDEFHSNIAALLDG